MAIVRSVSPPVRAPGPAPGALLVKFGRYPLHAGGVGVVRTLGRAGVAVYAIAEDRFTPAAVSRYCRNVFVAPTTGAEPADRLVATIAAAARAFRGPLVAIPTDDEAAVVLAEHREALPDELLVPAVAPGLPRRLASKQGLHTLCAEHGVPTPRTSFPATRDEIEEFARTARFPVVAKNVDPFVRKRAPAVGGTTMVPDPPSLRDLARRWPDPPTVMLQEYIPSEYAEDWIFHAYFDARSEPLVAFTGVKHRSWPPRFGATSFATVVGNAELAESMIRFCRRIGFAGIVDLDVRRDMRDGEYKLVDFNPRVGAQFRAFETDAGIDVVRAQYLDLAGRPVPPGEPVDGRRFVVEHLDAPALFAYRRVRPEPVSAPLRRGTLEWGWFSRDDLLPFAAMCVRAPALVADRFR